jgi:hypothetical protein
VKTRHTITVQPEVRFRVAGLEDLENAFPTLEVTFEYTPGRTAYTPRGEYGPIDPPDPAEVSLVSAKFIDGDGLWDPGEKQVEEWASDYLDTDEGYELACKMAESDAIEYEHDPDDAREMKRDRTFWEDW